MAPPLSADLDPTLRAFAETLDLETQPKRFHCAACQKFNFNPYKLDCCSQNICETCYSNLPTDCPVCAHTPLSIDLCKPANALRNTIKKHLKDKLAEKEAKNAPVPVADAGNVEVEKPVSTTKPISPPITETKSALVEEPKADDETPVAVNIDVTTNATSGDGGNTVAAQPAVDDPVSEEQVPLVEVNDAGEDDESDSSSVNIQVDMAEDDNTYEYPEYRRNSDEGFQGYQGYKSYQNNREWRKGSDQGSQRRKSDTPPEKQEETAVPTNGNTFSNMALPFPNMDFSTMQQMMNNFNPMMAMMNPMFSGYGTQGAGMNGMNNMAYQNQNMFPNWNQNIWQNDSSNNYSNGMNGGYGSGYGYNQQGYQQNYSNDYQNGYQARGYGRGRGRGRGGFGRGRGNFNQFQNNRQSSFQGFNGQQQYEQRDVQGPPSNFVPLTEEQKNTPRHEFNKSTEELTPEEDARLDAYFMPPGQDEVAEDMGADYYSTPSATNVNTPLPDQTETQPEPPAEQKVEPSEKAAVEPENGPAAEVLEKSLVPETPAVPVQNVSKEETPAPVVSIIPDAYKEDLDVPMAPPSAPLGPSAKHGDPKDYGFRSRGHGRFASKGRGTTTVQNGHASPSVKQVSQTPAPQGVGVVGAPTGPRAMREPRELSQPAQPPQPKRKRSLSSSNGGGFQIVGRASMQKNESRASEKPVSSLASQVNGYDDYKDQTPTSSKRARNETYESSTYHAKYDVYDHDYDRGYDDEKKRKRKRDESDYDARGEETYELSDQEYKHRSRHDKQRDNKERDAYAKPHSSKKSRKKYEDDYEHDDVTGYGDSSKNVYESERGDTKVHRSGGRSSSRYDEHDRADRHKDKDRKRSRNERVQEDDGVDEEEDLRSSRNRRHKKEHRRDEEAQAPVHDVKVNGRASSHKTSEASAPVAQPKLDPYAEERAKANAKRMEKEGLKNTGGKPKPQREINFKGAASARRINYKYEDEVERGMEKRERRW